LCFYFHPQLKKYFDSTRQVNERPESKGFAKEFIICTNNNFEKLNLEKNGVSLEEADESLEILERIGRKFKLKLLTLYSKGIFSTSNNNGDINFKVWMLSKY
jgi:hypothetical protein